jgi:hypothetical protein
MKWEYKVDKILMNGLGSPEHLLNQLGQDGWEAVALWDSTDRPLDEDDMHIFILLKRPISKWR